MGGEETSRTALEMQRGGIAVVDSDGTVAWTDDAWTSADGPGFLPRVPVGGNLLAAYREYADPRIQALANAIAAVFEGKATYFEMEHRAERGALTLLVTSVAALRGDGDADRAILIHRAVPERAARQPDARAIEGVSMNGGPERFTPREREVLQLMAVGLDNRAIAARLGIQYTTVRGHVRSVIEKLGARSRLAAVARAYQKGLVPR